ncbi:hypothetical protein KZZ52_33640 [Dactylosporangium sp. AC04546]|uniref:hypothetical protein n=1 Tax=Dactylosporangium sp. AC04546 TaxID=2862460 RepID=UPI001EDE7311|nr:hypothetical protein [Dactylosporangium sp. AC04546]WVK78919.1 hypothetical protein KZZ52_33640 [Dactylosporangium sp. AC04546]
MSTRRTPLVPIAVTASRLLSTELMLCADEAGTFIEIATRVPAARPHARRRPMVLIGFDVVRRVRNPFPSGGLVVLAGFQPAGVTLFPDAHRLGIPYVIGLPAAKPWLVGQLMHPPTC